MGDCVVTEWICKSPLGSVINLPGLLQRSISCSHTWSYEWLHSLINADLRWCDNLHLMRAAKSAVSLSNLHALRNTSNCRSSHQQQGRTWSAIKWQSAEGSRTHCSKEIEKSLIMESIFNTQPAALELLSGVPDEKGVQSSQAFFQILCCKYTYPEQPSRCWKSQLLKPSPTQP